MTAADHWEREALNWSAFVRGPARDAYEDYAPSFFELLPESPKQLLEVGCGEGRVSRDLRSRGYDPVGVDISPTLVRLAQQADPDGRYVVADAASLPFDDDGFGLVVAYNSLMDVDDLTRAVSEIARVLEPGGRLCVCVTHPFADAGRFSTREADAAFVVTDSYLERRPFELTVERNGVRMTFGGWAYPLEAYGRAFEDAGLLVEALREPAVPDKALERDPAEGRWKRMPAFLFIRAIKRGSGAL